MNTNTATEYRNLPLAVLTESATNPRRVFEDAALKELAESIRSQGVKPILSRATYAVVLIERGLSPRPVEACNEHPKSLVEEVSLS
jgi:ParB-like chromosome segregation protein Spo0J